jgi:glucokinase
LDLFLAAFGAFAGDMALACLARGGVYLAGGIAAKLLPVIAASPFITTFNAKAEHAGIAARMPVSIATDAFLGLHGAAFIASEARSRPC